MNSAEYICYRCGHAVQWPLKPKRTFAGFPRIPCPFCKKAFRYPLTTGYVVLYWVFFLVTVGLAGILLHVFGPGSMGILFAPILAAIAVALALAENSILKRRITKAATSGVHAAGLQHPNVITLNHTPLEDVRWPRLCFACDKALGLAHETEQSSTSAQSWGIPLVKGKGAVRVNVCSNCHRKLTSSEHAKYVGGFFAWVSIGGCTYLGMNGQMTPDLMSGAGGSFWLGWIVFYLADRFQRRYLANIQIDRAAEGAYVFQFKSCTFADAFRSNNVEPPKPDEPQSEYSQMSSVK